MPYVTQDKRVGLREPIDKISSRKVDSVELCIVVSNIALVRNGIMPYFNRLMGELRSREGRGEDITGDMNFCICRLLVGSTLIHTEPRYSKVNFINKTLRKAMEYVQEAPRDEMDVDRAAAVLDDVKMELYRRYAEPYEDLKCAENGDIMD